MKMTPKLFTRMLYHLQRGSYSRAELAEMTGLHTLTVGDYLREMHDQEVVFIKSWDPDTLGRYTVARYSLGMAEDAVKPPARTRREIHQKYRARKAAEAARSFKPQTNWIGGGYATASSA